MSYQTKLANANLELEKLVNDYRQSYAISTYDYAKRHKFEEATRKLKAKISRLESQVIAEQGPIVHKDMFGQLFTPGARVVWADSGRYAGFGRIWYVSYCTPKQVSLVTDPARVGETGTSTNPAYLLVVDKLVNPITPAKETVYYSIHDDPEFGSKESLDDLLDDYWNSAADTSDDIINVTVSAWILDDKKTYRTWYDPKERDVDWEEISNENGS